MAKIVTITNPLTGQPAQVDQLDHTAQQIDDGLNIARGVSNPNLLDNWYFGNPVDQRQGRIVVPNTTYYSDNQLTTSAGTTSAYVTAYRYATGTANGVSYASFKLTDSDTAPTYYAAPENVVRGYTGGGYGIDRYYSEGILIEPNGITLTDEGKYIFQNLDDELKKALDGKTVTVSALLSTGELLFGTKVYAAAPSAGEYFLAGTLHIVNSTNGGIMFWAAQKATIVAVKLELGTTQTLTHQDENGVWQLNEIPDYGEQLRRCQRYQRKIFISMLTATYVWNQMIQFSLNDVLNGMRATPALTLFGKQMDTAVSSTDGLMAVIPGGNGDSGWYISAGTTYSLLVENNSIIIKAIIPESKFTVTSNSGLNYALHCGEGVYIFADANL